MNTSIEIDDEILMAYADGELDAAQMERIEQLLQQNAAAAARVAQHRALRSQLHDGLSAVLSEPVPDHLLNMLQPHGNDTLDKVVNLAQVRQRKNTGGHWRAREWSAMAASLIAGIVLGLYALNFNSSHLVAEQGGALIAQDRLDTALTTQLASANTNQPIQIGISFRNQAGEYCRSFAVREHQALAGVACHSQDKWHVQMLTEFAPDTSSEFRQAGSAIPAAILTLIDQQISGEPLDAAGEAAARQSGWR